MGLRQYEMADALDIHWTTLSRWERGVAEPRLQHLWEVARLYLNMVLASELWAIEKPVPERRVPRAVSFCGEHGSPGVGWFVGDALARGERVNILLTENATPTRAWSTLTADSPSPGDALRGRQVRSMPLDSVFK
ncbi:MAG: helix-turn-helix transcriptional regulator, partial [Candidatus Bipolaricaulota bacterium]